MTPWTAAHQASLPFTISQSLLNSCPLGQWCHPTISSSVALFSSCPQSSPASGSFLMSWLLASGGQSIRAPATSSALAVNIQDWFPLGLTGLIYLQSKGLSRVFFQYQFEIISSSVFSLLHDPNLVEFQKKKKERERRKKIENLMKLVSHIWRFDFAN